MAKLKSETWGTGPCPVISLPPERKARNRTLCDSEHGLECGISNSLCTAAPFNQKQSENAPSSIFFSGERVAVFRLDFKPDTPVDHPLGRVTSRHTKFISSSIWGVISLLKQCAKILTHLTFIQKESHPTIFSEIFFTFSCHRIGWRRPTETSHVIMNSNSHGNKLTLNKINSSKPVKEGVLLLFVAMLSISCHTFPPTGHLW